MSAPSTPKAVKLGPMARTRILSGLRSTNDEAADHDIVTRVDEAAGADVRQLRRRRGVQIIQFGQPHTGFAVRSFDDCGVAPRG